MQVLGPVEDEAAISAEIESFVERDEVAKRPRPLAGVAWLC